MSGIVPILSHTGAAPTDSSEDQLGTNGHQKEKKVGAMKGALKEIQSNSEGLMSLS